MDKDVHELKVNKMKSVNKRIECMIGPQDDHKKGRLVAIGDVNEEQNVFFGTLAIPDIRKLRRWVRKHEGKTTKFVHAEITDMI